MQDVICPICGNENGNLAQDALLYVYLCAFCGHSFTMLPRSNQEIYSVNYFMEDHKNWFLHPNISLFKKIGEKIKLYFGARQISLLDVGCGKGDLLRFLKTNYGNIDLYGIDLVSNEGKDITFLRGDFFMHDFNMKFEVIASIMFVEHIDRPVLFIRKIYDMLKPNGIVFITTINSNSFIYRIVRAFKKMGLRGPYERLYHHHHLQHYTNDSLKKLLEDVNFETIYQKNHNFPLAAVDVPRSNFLLESIYKLGIAAIFAVTAVFGGGINQTIVCQKKQQK